jgi:tRNA U34 5-carboxymethylaminomethyl modifying GTPase MnmE/TrmE
LAIVSAVSGTTRDCLEARLQLNGQLVNVVDTAGIRADAECPLEREGIRRARDRAAEANLLLLVLDAGKLLELVGEVGRTAEMKEEEDTKKLTLLLPALLEEFAFDPERQQLIVCLNKADLVEEEAERRRVEKGGNGKTYYSIFLP